MSITSTLEAFDDSFTVPDVRPASRIPNGLFTLTMPDGEYRTFRVHTKSDSARFAPGQRILSLLTGPDNEKDYQPFAFVGERGFLIWKKHKGGELERLARYVWMLATGDAAPGFELTVSKRCMACNRPLTTPTSLTLGYGPECAKRMQGNG